MDKFKSDKATLTSILGESKNTKHYCMVPLTVALLFNNTHLVLHHTLPGYVQSLQRPNSSPFPLLFCNYRLLNIKKKITKL